MKDDRDARDELLLATELLIATKGIGKGGEDGGEPYKETETRKEDEEEPGGEGGVGGEEGKEGEPDERG